MYRIYHDGVAAIVVDETNHCFCYTSLPKHIYVRKRFTTTYWEWYFSKQHSEN
ncbi:TPA: hypothetical protein ACGBG5_003285 [Enterococcus faecalis]